LLLHVALLASLAAPSGTGDSWRIQARPADDAERALRQCLDAVEAKPDAEPSVTCLLGVSAAHPGTTASGLAQLDAGLVLLGDDRAKEALPHLAHPDMERTRVRDWALLAAGMAHEDADEPEAAVKAYLAAAAEPDGAVACDALPRAASLQRAANRNDEAAAALEQALERCRQGVPDLLSDLAAVHLARGDRKAAALALDRLDRDYPASAAARDAQARLRALAKLLPTLPPAERAQRRLRKGEALLEAGRSTDALTVLRSVEAAALPADDADRARILLARAALARGRRTEAEGALRRVKAGSPHAAEAAFEMARAESRRHGSPDPFLKVADSFPGTKWAEEALLAGGNYYQKDALDEKALPWYQRLVLEYPSGEHAERAAWRVGWADFRAGRYEDAAQIFERTARLRPPSRWTASFLYWAARSRLAQGQQDRARHLLAETVQRYKYAYHGLRAIETLARLGGEEVPSPPAVEATPAADVLPETRLERLRQLLLADHLDGAAAELERMGDATRVRSTLAWVQWRQGKLLDGLITMKRAHPEWISAAGDRLPEEVWHVLFPIRFEDVLREQAASRQLDPALVAGLILQESSFDPAALSRAGARGLMQVMPSTGRHIARTRGLSFRRSSLHDPSTSLDFGTHYLRQVSDRFGGDVEKVLAAYNAGPRRVDQWTAVHPDLGPEEFIESIPFTETRQYVMLVLANREQYRRLYGLDRTPAGPVLGSTEP
jgi:soluble lytic murein transglycosylase